MVYGSNVLPSDAAYYQLTKASIKNGTLSIEAGGSVKCILNRTQLSALTEYFRVNLVPTTYTDSYEPKVYVRIDVETVEAWYNYTLFPVQSNNGVFTTEIKFEDVDYLQFTFEIAASESISFTLWEMCPESVGNVEVVINGVKQSLPKLLYDYNTTEITVEQSEQIVGMINCYLIGNTDLQGHFLMNFTATERCTVHLRFFDSAMVELFSPIVHTVNNGYNTLEVPHAYLKKLAGIHTFYVTAQTTNGSLTIPIRGILYTIDGGYLAERLMNPGMDVSDITIKQLKTDREPSEIWAIGVDSGRVIVKKREYDLSKPNLTWDAVYVVGEGTTGAIEFDGNWVRRDGATAYTIETDTLPAIAFVDTEGTLWLYQHGMSGEPLLIDTDVTCISMVRGYKSDTFPDQDQGLILCWVRDGNVYYRQYAYFNGSYEWYPVEQLTETNDITFVQVHRLNDYRIGIITQGASKNTWYITGRTYVSQAVPTEILHNFLLGDSKLITMTQEEVDGITFEAVPNTLVDIRAAQSDFYMTFKYPKFIALAEGTIDQWKYHINVSVNSEELDEDEYDLSIEGASLHVHLHEATWGIVKVSWNRVGIRFYLDDARYIINTQASYSFTWNIWKSKSHTQPVETTNALLTGAAAFQYIEINRPVSNQPTPIAANLGGTFLFQYIEVNRPSHPQIDKVNASLEGTTTFTMVLVGNQPI